MMAVMNTVSAHMKAKSEDASSESRSSRREPAQMSAKLERTDVRCYGPGRASESAPVSRRQFLGATATTVAAFTIIPRHVLGGPKFVPPSEKVNIAIVGCGGQGRTNVRALFNEADAQIIAVADPIESHDLEGFYY